MAGRLMILRASRRLRGSLLSSSFLADVPATLPNAPTTARHHSIVACYDGILLGDKFRSKTIAWARQLSSSARKFPQFSDPDLKTAINRLFATSWLEIDSETREIVENSLAKASADKAGYDALLNSWHAAQAVEKFSDALFSLKMELDELSGAAGETVEKLPEGLYDALQAAFSRYTKYLSLFQEDETYLKKKVETELGSVLILIKQRCSGLDADWGEIALLGTSGLSGSYIERRH
ncbi:hypothetical protein O6H91_08G038800 [Diphasiastrum complanatum]|uniref:Uncharacterized protein n=1 Tax=Diphasiastrum complanatum TaxID=34168 RepID=A0ACC2CWJ2_DIPCM|nr:hypothetical protein O6H91_08G038800 [Diphasiastrum complanatum]